MTNQNETTPAPDYAWKTYCTERERDVYGPSGITESQIAELDKGKGQAWKTKCDDDEVMDRGRIIGDYDQFEPLDDFSGPDKGAVSIWYYEKSKKTQKWSWHLI